MHGGHQGLGIVAAIAVMVAGCTADDGKLNIRPIADPLSDAAKRGSPMIAEARGALSLGNVGTALEAFRRALRERPDSIEALAGIAACYERMGRYDLSRVNYEAALAIAPNNPVLLNSFAASLQSQGRVAEANALRAEAAQTEAAQVATAVALAKADLAEAQAVAVATKPAAPVPPLPQRQTAAVAPPAVAQIPAAAVHKEVAGTTQWTFEMPKVAAPVAAKPSVTVALPAPRPAAPAPAAKATALADLPKPQPDRQPEPAKVLAALPHQQPRLQRLSFGEVALLTGTAPAWRTEVVAQSARSVTARFVPLKAAPAVKQAARFVPLQMAAVRPNIRLLNAARHQGLAARTRLALASRGWRRIEIGDAAQVRARSLVLYPADRQALGRRLAAQFGFASAVSRSGDDVVVLLGRDAPARAPGRARG